MERLRRALADAYRSLVELGYLFSAAEADLGREFGEMRTRFAGQALPAVPADLDQWVDSQAGQLRRGRVRFLAFDRARGVTARVIQAWLDAIEPEAERLYDRTTRRFVTLANEFLSRLVDDRTGATPDAPRGPGSLVVERGFHERRRFYFASLMSRTAAGPLAWLGDRVLPRRIAARRVKHATRAYGGYPFTANSMRVEYDLRERVLESRRWLEKEIRARLTEAVAAGQRPLDEAQAQRARGEEAVEGRRARLRELRDTVAALHRRAANPPAGALPG